MRIAAATLVVVGALGALGAIGACTTRTAVHGTYADVWNRSQSAVQAVRFKAADTGAMHQRLEKDHAAGTLKYVWSDGFLNDTRVLTLRIAPTAGDAASNDATAERTVTIEAWSWGLFGFMQMPDGSTAELVRLSIEKEFGGTADPERRYDSPSAARSSAIAPGSPPPTHGGT